jgi:DNA anti-recombination protein RmuC
MAEEKKIVKGGFRATLALLISIIALILSFLAFHRTVSQNDLNSELESLQEKVKDLKQETSDRVEKVRHETGKTIEKIGKAIRKEEAKP